MTLKSERTLFVFFLFDVTGVALRERNLIHWLLLIVNFAVRFSYLFLSIKYMKFSLFSITFLLRDLNSLVLLVISLVRVQSMRELFALARFLSKKHYILLRIVDAVFFVTFLASLAFEIFTNGLDQCYGFNKLLHLEGNSTLILFVQRTFCFHKIFLINDTNAYCALYILIFVIFFFIKVQHLNEISSHGSSCWRRKLFTVSSQVSELSLKLDNSTSFILFFRAVNQFLCVILVFLLAMLLTQEKSFAYESYMRLILRNSFDLFLTSLLFISISLMQERIQERCDSLSRQIIYSALPLGTMHENVVLSNIFTSDFTQQVTLWKLIEVSRSIIFTLASVYVAFPILFWQVNNGALGHLNNP